MVRWAMMDALKPLIANVMSSITDYTAALKRIKPSLPVTCFNIFNSIWSSPASEGDPSAKSKAKPRRAKN